MPILRRKNPNTSRRWAGLPIGALVLSAGLAAWFLDFGHPSDPMQVSEIDNSEQVVSTETNTIPEALLSGDDETEPVVEVLEPPIQDDSPLKSTRAPTRIRDLAARERLELSRGRALGPGAAEVAARNAELLPSEAEQLNMTSPELVDELASSPLQMSIYHSSDNRLDGLLASFARTHMGVDILLSRPDAASALLETYRACSDSLVVSDTPADEPRTGIEFTTLDVLLGSATVLEQFESEGQLPALIETALQSAERRAHFDAAQSEPVYGEAMLDQTATVVGRALVRLDDPNFLLWLAVPEREGIFSERTPTYEETREILDMAATAYGPEILDVSPGDAAQR